MSRSQLSTPASSANSAREIALDIGTVLALGTERGVPWWLLGLSLVDAGEALAFVLAIWQRTVPPAVWLAYAAADLGGSAAGFGVLIQMIRDPAAIAVHLRRRG
jgi:hypothetical protein